MRPTRGRRRQSAGPSSTRSSPRPAITTARSARRRRRPRRKEAAGEVEKLSKERDDLTAVLAKIDERKAEILAAAKLPVEGLAIGDDGIELAGVPFAQA